MLEGKSGLRSKATAPRELVQALEEMGIPAETYDFLPNDGMRRLIARRMVESVSIAPHFSVEMMVELEALLALREVLNSGSDARVSVNDMIIKAAGLALRACPKVNVTFTDCGTITHHHADIAFAVAMEGGLITPIICRAETKGLRDIAEEARDLAVRGRNKRLKPHEYLGGSFCISNLGMFGISRFNAIINQPHSAILSIGKSAKEQVFDEHDSRIVTRCAATLTSDHRVIDGALAAEWLQQFKTCIENPDRLL